MAAEVDLVVRDGLIVDPRHGRRAVGDIAVDGGQVVAVGGPYEGAGRTEFRVAEQLVVPGLVDLHVHLSSPNGGRVGHAMLARAGVTTALDLSGPVEDVLTLARSHGAGLTIATVEALTPDDQLPRRPTPAQIAATLTDVQRRGGIGVKLHVDRGWDPDVSAAIVAAANQARVWVASHCGTTVAGSNVEGLRETLEFSGDARLQIAHVNSYCRGELDDPVYEAEQAVELLRAAPTAVSESYLDRVNATWGEFRSGRAVNPRLPGWLQRAGFDPDESGLVAAIESGWAAVASPESSDVRLLIGAEGIEAWRAAGTRLPLCLPLNPAASRVNLAVSRGARGFDVTALATDGGGLPRNTTLLAGLALVDLGYLSLDDLIEKASRVPAELLGLDTKGHLGVGADADIAVVDPVTRRVRMTIAAGCVVMRDGNVLGHGSRVMTTAAADAVGDVVLDVAASGLYTRSGTRSPERNERS